MKSTPMLAMMLGAVLAAADAHAQAPRRVVLVPEAVLTTEDGPAAVSDAADVAVGRDGSLYVVQRTSRAVLVFTADGRPARTLGRGGRGPGEFAQAPGPAGWRGDTLVVADAYGGRLHGFLGDGRSAFTRTFTGIERFLPRALLDDGRMFGERLAYSEDIVAGRMTTTDLMTWVDGAGPARTIARLPLRHHTARILVGSGRGQSHAFFFQPYADADLFDVDPFGRWVVGVTRPAATGPARAVFSVSWLTRDGSVMRTARVPYLPVRLAAPAVRETRAFYTEMFAGIFKEEPRARLERLVRDAVFVPEFYPPVAEVVCGNDGSTWIRRAGPGSAATWMAFDARGRHVAYVTAPAKGTLMAATATHAWGVATNADDVTLVTRYRLQISR